MSSLTDEKIIQGFEHGDECITRDYFYGYCREAYRMLNRNYQLSLKTGLDFFTLAHTYYLKLMTGGWQQLSDRKPGMTLRQWMIGGFKFVTLDAIKAYNLEHLRMKHTDNPGDFEPSDRYSREEIARIIEEICEAYYGDDRRAQEILRMSLIYGYKGKEVAEHLGMTPSAVSQRMKKMIDDVVKPYFLLYYVDHEVMASSAQKSERIMYSLSPIAEESYYKESGYMRRIPKNRITPDHISRLKEGQVFVFGSNLQGMHAGGAARMAMQHFGAKWGQGVGLQGQSYAIPTMQGPVSTIRPYVAEFTKFAKEHPKLQFMVTRVGCGIAGFDPDDIAPLFRDASELPNVTLPKAFWDEL